MGRCAYVRYCDRLCGSSLSDTRKSLPVQPLARLAPTRDAFDDIARSILNGATPPKHAALLVAELDEFDALAKRAGNRAAETVAANIGRLLVSLLRADDGVRHQPDGRFFVLLPGNTGDEVRLVGERRASAVRIHGLAAADRSIVERLSVAVGVAAMPEHGTSITGLYPAANTACARV